MCRVKTIASSVERLLRYANCSGSSEAGRTEQMWSLMSFSKLAEDGCQSNGPPVIQACDFIFLRYGHNGGFFCSMREPQIESGKGLRCL